MLNLLLTLMLAVPCPHPHRSRTATAAFRRAHSCPGGPDRGSTSRCEGYVIDHICPLACGGRDDPSNMQWMDVTSAKVKDRWELACKTCPAGTRCRR